MKKQQQKSLDTSDDKCKFVAVKRMAAPEARRLADKVSKLWDHVRKSSPWHPLYTDTYRFTIDKATEILGQGPKLQNYIIQMLAHQVTLKVQKDMNGLLEKALKRGAEIASNEIMLGKEDIEAYEWRKEIEEL